MTQNPKILILDEPTAGIDVKGKAELLKIISDLVSDRKSSVILFSSNLDEVVKLADRIIVLYKGRVFKEFSNRLAVKEEVLHNAVQGIA